MTQHSSPTFEALSEQQRGAMLGGGNLLLTACPGSGKTRSVAARAAWLKSEGVQFALLSHTNVGAREIASATYADHHVQVRPESYVGTLHSFFVRYVLLPFGHLVTGAVGPVRMDEEAVRGDEPEGLSSCDYRFTVAGELEAKNARGDRSAHKLAAVREYKEQSAALGFVSYDDALHWSHRVLTERPDLARALVARFSEILIDEAQDCNPLQLACLRKLHAAGLPSLVLVGDFDQSIFGFGGATPELCKALAADVGLAEVRLSENYRSSQLICDVSARFRASAEPDLAVGADHDYPVPPQLLLYDAANPSSLQDAFNGIMQTCPGGFDSAVIVTRANMLANAIRGRRINGVPDHLRLLLQAKAHEGRLSLDQMKDLERVLLRHAFGPTPPSFPLDLALVRTIILDMITDLPGLTGGLSKWAEEALGVVEKAIQTILPVAEGRRLYQLPSTDDLVEDVIGTTTVGFTRVESVHGVKGESVDAVMVVAETPSKTWHTPQADTWAAQLSGSSPTTEESRIFYVAATRARRLLILALPEGTSASTISMFTQAGFSLRD